MVQAAVEAGLMVYDRNIENAHISRDTAFKKEKGLFFLRRNHPKENATHAWQSYFQAMACFRTRGAACDVEWHPKHSASLERSHGDAELLQELLLCPYRGTTVLQWVLTVPVFLMPVVGNALGTQG